MKVVSIPRLGCAFAAVLLGCGGKGPAPEAIPPVPPPGLFADAGPGVEDDFGFEDDEGEGAVAPAQLPAWAQEAARQITAHADGKTRAWERLAYVADRFGHRLSGSKALEDTIDWAVETMAKDGLDNARREKVMVPHWVRGKESLRVLGEHGRELRMLGLGMSVGTRGALRAELVVVENLEQLQRGDLDVKGKIVLIDQRMPPFDHERQESGYGHAVQGRSRGAIEAGKRGARAVLVRSVTAISLDSPHTGAMQYEDGVPKIPAAAVTLEAAEYLVREAARGKVELELRMEAKHLPDAPSANVVAELRGRDKPEEIVVIGGHIDSWDVGDGSTDDGAGCMMAMEAALMLRELELVPRRTIRVVLFTNEENGLRGAKAYFEAHGDEPHVAAIEADSGSGAPRGFGIASEDGEVVRAIADWSPLFAGLGATEIDKGWGGADISPLMDDGVLGLSLQPDHSHYFDLHHSPADTIEKIDPANLQKNAAAMALMAYLLAERE
ncbi:M20/M25/M40 family metallo-hydrolase [Paraliomyxa miuraensis]|uniref:M20/M25/M40 family metallo-hydrolase n=1 Tax=Paraliomyxa miuraensis TaxID=376150 RepID=UPI00224DE422|nr:M20/M25/M40 family metallo-hydrolase [Paraliomyxa miuraensis]MCX4247093.1 M20/M25/M40 family metallo-hydrolase [Paraliomyxa miuraensis]